MLSKSLVQFFVHSRYSTYLLNESTNSLCYYTNLGSYCSHNKIRAPHPGTQGLTYLFSLSFLIVAFPAASTHFFLHYLHKAERSPLPPGSLSWLLAHRPLTWSNLIQLLLWAWPMGALPLLFLKSAPLCLAIPSQSHRDSNPLLSTNSSLPFSLLLKPGSSLLLSSLRL